MPTIMKTPVIRGSTNHIEAVIAAATLNGLWDDIKDLGVAVYVEMPAYDLSCLVCWAEGDAEVKMWEALVALAHKVHPMKMYSE